MKYTKVLLFIIPLKLICQISYIYPKIPTDHICDLHYLNQDTIIFINKAGSIYKSYDGGDNWELKEHYSGFVLEEIHFIDDQIGFIKTSSYSYNEIGLIYTTDSGENWDNHNISINKAVSFLPISESILLKSTLDGEIYRLDNYYNDWQISYQYITYLDSLDDIGIFEVPYGYIRQFEKCPSGSILALGVNENAYFNGIIDDSLSLILQSDDYGFSWDTLWIGLTEFVNKISFNDDSIGWMNVNDSLYKTTDGGISWINQNIIGINGFITDICVVAEDELYAVTEIYGQQFIKSTNSGESWEIRDIEERSKYKISFYDEISGFLFGSDLIKTVNGGQSWTKCDTSNNTDIYDIDFVSMDKGFSLGDDGLYITHDGGHSWKKQFNPEGISTNHNGNIQMLNNLKGWLITFEKIYKTEDGGYTWNNVILSNKDQRYQGVEFYDENLGILYSVSEEESPDFFATKHHYITTNGGETWIPKDIIPDTVLNNFGYFNKMQFSDSYHLWAINQQGLWLSNDTASSWKQVFAVDYFVDGYSFDFYNSNIGILSKAGYFYYFTIDGGKSWQTIQKDSYNSPIDCKILGPDIFGEYRILEAGKQGNLIRCSIDKDGIVQSNQSLNTFTDNDLNKIAVYEEENIPYVWIAGDDFSILYRAWEKVCTEIKDSEYYIVTFSLDQNYPNPFNPITTIKYSIEKPAFTDLILYNILGESVLNLVNEYKNVGVYEVQLDASNLPSGVYFYYLRSGSYIQSRKMLLLK